MKLVGRTLVLASVLATFFSVAWFSDLKVAAVSTSDWKAGYIISDPLFFNGNAMSIDKIQAFLNGQVGSCDTWGNKIYSGNTTRAQYGTSIGVPPPYICVKDFYENPTTHATNFNPSASIPVGAKSAAQIIYEASVRYNINPQVILVTIKKEAANNLLSDDWPFLSQYRSAMGYGCPDTAPCDAEYYGFYNQVENAAKQFRRYANYPQEYRYKTGQTNFIQYNPNAACSGTNVLIESQATAGLYNYTPYQPNAAALANLYGTGDSCSAYGNRNFWRIWSDWFGSTIDARLFYRVIRGDQRGEVYLQTHQGKYYVSSYDLLAEWGLGPANVIVIPQSQVDTLPTKNNLSNTLTDGAGRLYIVEGGNLHEVTSQNHTAIWGINTSSIVESLGLTYTLPKKEPLGRFMTLRNGDGSIWLADGQNRHHMSSGQLLYAWGYYPGITTTVSPYLFNLFAAKNDASMFATVEGGGTWAIEASTKRGFKNDSVRQAYVGQITPTSVKQQVINMLNDGSTLTNFAINNFTKQWFLIDRGMKRYIPQGELAALWGKPDLEPLSSVSNDLLSTLQSAQNVSYVARSESSGTYWLIAKNKHAITDGSTYFSISGSTVSPEVYSDNLINSLPVGSNASSSIKSSQSPFNYPYLLDAGKRRYPYTASAQSAWTRSALSVPYQLMTVIPEASFIGNIVKNQTGAAYYVEDGVKYPIQSTFYSSFGVTETLTQVDTSSTDVLATGNPMNPIIKTMEDKIYIISDGKKIPLTTYRDTLSSQATSLPIKLSGVDSSNGESSYLISSKNTDEMWLLSGGQRIPLPLFEQRVSLGYLSKSIQPTKLTTSTIDAIPLSSQQFNLLIQKPGSGIKFLSFGHALGFPDGATLIAYSTSTKPVLQVSSSVFDSIPLQGDASRLIYDDSGRYWWVEGGAKRYITSWESYYRLGYPQLRSKYLYGTTMSLLPTAQQIQ